MANGHGGRRQGAGRKPGSASQKTREIANQAATDGLTPLEYMLAVLRDDTADARARGLIPSVLANLSIRKHPYEFWSAFSTHSCTQAQPAADACALGSY